MDLNEALSDLLPDGRTGDLHADLLAAARETWRRRNRNTETGAAVLAALIDSGMTYRQLEREVGIPKSVAHRWATPPAEAGT